MVFQNIETNIDTTEIINISTPRKGKWLFKEGDAVDFSAIIFLFGSLYMLFMGLFRFQSDELSGFSLNRKNTLVSVFSRLVFLNLSFLAVFLISYFYAILRGISFSNSDTAVFTNYCLYTFVLLAFFYLLGLFAFSIFTSRRIVKILLIWFLAVFAIPRIANMYLINEADKIPPKEELNKKKIGILMDFEREVREKVLELIKEDRDRKEIHQFHKEKALKYLDEGYILNQKSEAEYTGLYCLVFFIISLVGAAQKI